MHYISLKQKDGSYKHYKCCKEIYNYIKQLELHVRYPGLNGLRDLYPQRFNPRFKRSEYDF